MIQDASAVPGADPVAAELPASRPPDRPRALASYRAVARRYDERTSFGEPYRRQSVRRLSAGRGDVVLDVGCGTGLNFPPIQEKIGAGGRLVGIDLSPEMLACARARASRHGWSNVTLVESAVEEVEIPVEADAALFSLTHDILRSPCALENVLGHVRPGGRVVAAGAKWAPWWWPGSLPLNLWVSQMNASYVTTFEGFSRPWSHLARLIPDLEVQDLLPGFFYIAAGTRPAAGN
jgi:ubiquinone/menaquinone biosynthesis C-methylase UbiE